MNNIIVSKFGGTSMGTSSAMILSAKICKEHKSNIAVVSATSGTTDQLIQIATSASRGQTAECEKLVFALKERHNSLLAETGETLAAKSNLENLFTELDLLIQNISLLKELTPKANDHILSLGERISSLIFTEVLQCQLPDTKVVLLDARSIIKTDSSFGKATPLIEKISQMCANLKNDCVYVTQGFIGSDLEGNTTILGRGGSDYSAALFAEGMNASILEIWTDVAGIATTDPRIYNEAKIISEITYAEAAEMAHYGAKVLHPATIAPAVRKGIPVFVGSTFESQLPGTWIKQNVQFKPAVRAITKRSAQSLLTITNPNMLNAYGFMQEIFGIFGNHRISVDCVTTSEISIAVTVDTNTLKNEQFMHDLGSVGQIEVESGFSLISLIGNDLVQRNGLAKTIFSSMEDTPIRMMGFGASPYNFNFLVKDVATNMCIQKLHRALL
jgi:aspartate kinase